MTGDGKPSRGKEAQPMEGTGRKKGRKVSEEICNLEEKREEGGNLIVPT